MTERPEFIDWQFCRYYRKEGHVKEGFWIKGQPTVSEVVAYLENNGYDLDTVTVSGSSVEFKHYRPATQDELEEDARKLQHYLDNQERWERAKLAELKAKYESEDS